MSAPIGYYATCDEAECASCHRPEDWPGFDDWEAPLPIYYGTAADTPTHCCQCGELIPHALTAEGYADVREALAASDGHSEVLARWSEAYGGGNRGYGLVTPERSVPERTAHAVRLRWRNNEHRIATYREMLDVAQRRADAYEIDRIGEILAELESQREDIIDWADRVGIRPDELDAPTSGTQRTWQDDDTERGGE